MTNTILLAFGGPSEAAHEEEVAGWYEGHLEQMCSLPGITAAHLYRPSSAQFPRTTANLPQMLGVYEHDTHDLAGAIDALSAARQAGDESGVYEAGRSIPGPPDGAYATDPNYQTAYYNLVSRCPRGAEMRLTGQSIFMVFGGPTKPELEEEILRWYVDWHLEEICSLPGVSSGHLMRPSNVQLPGFDAKLPEVLAFYDYDTDDLPGAISAAWAAHLEGMKTGTYEPGRSIPGPVEGIWALNRQHQSAFYELVSRWTTT